MKVMGVAHVTKDITVYKFGGVIANITTRSRICLSGDGREHDRSLHISIKCLDTILSRVLVDTRSSLDVMPKTTLMNLTLEGVSMNPSTLIVKAFNGSR